MRNNNMSLKALVELINREALALNHPVVDLEHVLLALTKSGGIESKALSDAGASYDLLLQFLLKHKPRGEGIAKDLNISRDVKTVFDQMSAEMRANRDNRDFGYYLLKNLLWTDSLAVEMLRNTNVDPKEVFDQLDILKHKSPESGKSKTPNLDKFGEDLNEKSKTKIDGVIGREKEISRIIQILTRRTKNNPVLIGEAGVGKTAIVEGLAKKIQEGAVPDVIRDKRIINIDMANLVAGTKYRGDFEKRISDTLNEAKENEDIILFIDEIHTLIGAGSSEGSLDASNILKPYLSRGDITVIGATTINEYRKYIEKEVAFERRMQPIMVEEPTVDETIQIIKGIRDNYEKFHRINITDEVIEEAAKLSDRYLVDRFLPDKAIDVIDEACSNLKVDTFRFPAEQVELEKEIASLEEDKQAAINVQNFEEAAFLRDRIKTLEIRLADIKNDFENDTNFKATVSVDTIRRIVSEWSKVPVEQMTMEESEKYKNLDKSLKEVVIGQDEAVDVVSKAIKRARVGLKGADKPIGTFIFVGPTGVGKTYLAQAIATELFGSKEDLIRIDMSEFMEKHSVSKLIGSPPGYVGYEEGGQLTDKVRSNPYSVILFDEIEKAHPDVFNILLQILDEGRLQDSQGTEVDFTNTVIILTSNAGASRLSKHRSVGFSSEAAERTKDYENIKNVINEELKNLFKPEFLNRIDDIVVFNRLSKDDVKEIVKLELDDLIARVEDLGYKAEYSDSLVDYISEIGFDENYGARPINRAIKSNVEDEVANMILDGDIKHGDRLLLEIEDKKVKIEKVV